MRTRSAATPKARASVALLAVATIALTTTAGASMASGPKNSQRAHGLTVGGGGERATIYRDGYGVPSIYANHMAGVWFGAGYAQAQDRLVQLELTRRGVEGTLAAILGPGLLGQDETVRTFFYTPKEVEREYARLPAWGQQALQAYSDGINAWVAKAYADESSQKKRVPYEFFVLGQLLGLNGPYKPPAWQPTDTVAVGNYLARQFGGGGGSEIDYLSFLLYLIAEFQSNGDPNAEADARAVFNDALWLNDRTAPTTVPPGTGSNADGSLAQAMQAMKGLPPYLERLPSKVILAAAEKLRADRQNIAQTGQDLKILWRDGSNAFAVAPQLSASGNALLWGAPQEGFGTPSVDVEEYLHGPGYDAGGMAITGEPFILIGHNGNIAWTTTSEELVDTSIYVETVDYSTDPPQYLFDGQYYPMKKIEETIHVAGEGSVTYDVYRTIHGPVVALFPDNGVAISVRFASWMHENGTLQGFAEMGGDQNLQQYQASVSKITTLHNFFYADRQGNIAYYGSGLLPVLPSCQLFCDPRLPANGDGSQEWKGFVPFAQMPHSVDPPQGFLVNWNTKPDTKHYYQQNGGDEYWGTIYRSTRIAQDIQSKAPMQFTDMPAIEHDIGTIDGDDTLRPAAPYFLPYLLKSYRRLVKAGDPLVDPATHPDLKPSIDALGSWNGHTALGSVAMYLFVEWMESLQRNMFGGGLNQGEQYVGGVNFADASIGMGTFLGQAKYNLEYHILAGITKVDPCKGLCYTGDYWAGNEDHILVESLNDAIAMLSGTGPLLGNGGATGFGTDDVSAWKWSPWKDINWDDLDPLAEGVDAHLGTSPSQERSTYMQAIELRPTIFGINVLPPGQSGFISSGGHPDEHFGDQVPLFNRFEYKPMPPT